MNKTKAYSKVSRQLTAILKGMDDWEDLKVFQKSIAMSRSDEFKAAHKRLIGTKRWVEYTARFKARWPGITNDPDGKLPYPEAFIDAQVEWLGKHKDVVYREASLKRLEEQRKKLKKAKRLE